jgi:hypothetical protein
VKQHLRLTQPSSDDPRRAVRLASGSFWKPINSTRYHKHVQLYRRVDGRYVARYTSDPPSRRDRLEFLGRVRAQRLYNDLPDKAVPVEEAFPAPQFTRISVG